MILVDLTTAYLNLANQAKELRVTLTRLVASDAPNPAAESR